jgi:WD40 repeat protein
MVPSELRTAATLLVVPLVAATTLVLSHRACAPGAEKPDPPGVPPAAGLAHADVLGDPLPAGAVARLGPQRLRESGPVLALAIAPDGKTLVSASAGHLHRWAVAGGKETNSWSPRPGPGGLAVAVSPDCRTAVWESGGDLVLWALSAGTELRRLRGHRENVLCVAFSPDGKTLASVDRTRAAVLWDVGSGQELYRLIPHGRGGPALAFSPDGKILATGTDTVRIWDVASGKMLRQLAGSGQGIASVAFAPDGKTLASGEGDRTIRLWDPATAAEVRRIEGLAGVARPLAFAQGGRTLVAGTSGPETRLGTWDASTGKELWRAGGSEEFLTCLVVSPDGRTVATGGVDRAVRLWNVATGTKILGGDGHLGPVGAIAFAPDGNLLATAAGAGVGGPHPILLWDPATSREVSRLPLPPGRLSSGLAFSPDGTTLASLTNGAVEFWDLAARKVREGRIVAVPSVRDFRYVGGGKVIATIAGQVDMVNRLGRRIPGTVAAAWWDLAGRRKLHQLGGHDFTGLRGADLSGDGRTLIVLSSADNKIHLRDIPTGKDRSTFDPPPGRASWVYSPDARVMAWRNDSEAAIHLQETASGGKELARLPVDGPTQPARSATMRMLFSPDGKMFAAAVQRTITVWDVGAGKELNRFRSDQPACEALAFSADGTVLASGGSDSTSLIWEVRSRERK